MVEKKRKNGGFTLVELIVAVALFAIVIGPLFRAFSSSIQANSRARGVLKATQMAQSVLDNIERYNVQELRDDMPYADVTGNILPPGCGTVTFTRTTHDTDEVKLLFTGVHYQDMNLNVVADITKGGTVNTNTGNKYFMYAVNVWVYMNKGAGASLSGDCLVHLTGSVQNKD